MVRRSFSLQKKVLCAKKRKQRRTSYVFCRHMREGAGKALGVLCRWCHHARPGWQHEHIPFPMCHQQPCRMPSSSWKSPVSLLHRVMGPSHDQSGDQGHLHAWGIQCVHLREKTVVSQGHTGQEEGAQLGASGQWLSSDVGMRVDWRTAP